MKYLFIAFLFVSLFGHSQGIEPSSFQGNPNKGGLLKGVTLHVDDFGDTTYLYVHVDSTSIADSIYLRGDSLILLKNGSGHVYKNRIHTGFFSSYDIPNPQKYDISVNTDQTSYWYDGSDWVTFDGDTNPFNEGELSLHDVATNVAGIRSSTNYFALKKFVGLNGIQISTNELDSLNIGIDTTLFTGETQYLNPYVITGDTVGFYLTVAVDTVLFENTIDTAAYCCPPSIGNDTLYIGDNYVVLPYDSTLTFNAPLSRSVNTISIPAATTSVSGHLTSTDWNTFNSKFTLPSLTNGSVLFSNGTTISQDNANLFWDDTNNALEISGIPISSLYTQQLSFGSGAGSGATGSIAANFFGYNSGNGATSASYSNFFGQNSGLGATSSLSSNFFGRNSGNGATSASYSNFFGQSAGQGATSSLQSNFFGRNAGFNATGAESSNFFGRDAGYGAVNVSNSNLFGYNVGRTFTSNNIGTNNIIIGTNISLPNSAANCINIGGILFGSGTQSSTSGNPKIVATSGGKIGVMTVTPAQTLDVTGTARITDSDGTSTTIMGRDADGDVSAITPSYGITLASNTLKADTTSANGLATQYDLTQVSGGSSKVIDILGSDFTTSATSLQTTDLAYTFPTTGTYEVKVYGSYTCSNTANGLSIGWIDSGGLVASYITGKHSAFTNNSSSSSTEFRKPISAIGTTLLTASVNAASTPYTLISETLITVSTAGTITYGFASGSGSYSSTLQAGSSLIVEKLN